MNTNSNFSEAGRLRVATAGSQGRNLASQAFFLASLGIISKALPRLSADGHPSPARAGEEMAFNPRWRHLTVDLTLSQGAQGERVDRDGRFHQPARDG
jgi:hypothetical protein